MRRLLLSLALAGLLVAGCGEDEQLAPRPSPEAARERPNNVRGPGFITERPRGFTSAGAGGVGGGVVLALIGPYRSSERYRPNITVTRASKPASSSAKQARDSVRSHNEGHGGRSLRRLPDRELDGEPAIGDTYPSSAAGAKLTQRTYAVVHGRQLYTIDATTPQKSAVDGEKVLETVLDAWRWED